MLLPLKSDKIRMKKYILILTGVLILPLFSFGQFWEVGAMLGASNYSGDLSQDPVTLSETNPAGGVLLRYNINPNWSIKGNAYYGEISGNDSNGNSTKHKERALSFRSMVLDIGANVEYNFLGFESGSRTGRHTFSPYAFVGVSVFHFNPQAFYTAPGQATGSWVDLQPLGTEAQGTTFNNNQDKYNLTQIAIPFGVGVKLNVYENYNVGFEFGWRKTFTDYLDDVSGYYPPTNYLQTSTGSLTAERLSNKAYWYNNKNPAYFVTGDTKLLRGDPTTDDWYMFAGITITYTFLPAQCFKF